MALEDKGFHVVYDLAAQKLPWVSTAVVAQKTWVDANHEVAQRYIDSLIQGTARSRSDKELALRVLRKYLKNDDQHAVQVAYDFFVGQVMPQYPEIKPENFDDAIAQLSVTNDKINAFDYKRVLGPRFVQSAMARHIGQ